MKILKKILIVLAIIIAIPLIVALFTRKEYSVQREITINRSNEQVFDYVKHLKNQDNYSKWVMMDPAMKKDFKGTDGTVGFVYAWNGNDEAGEGEQVITDIVEGQKVDVAIHFIRPFEGDALAPIETTAISENQTKVRWGMTGRSPYPMNFMNLFIDKMLGPQLEESLENLKTILEKS